MVRTEPLGVRVSPEVKAKLLAAAKAEDRALASLVERILKEWIAENVPRGTKVKKL